MSILYRHIFARVLRTAIASVAAVLVVIWTTEALGRLELLDNGGLVFVKVASLLLPSLYADVTAFGVLLAVMLTLRAMNQDRETTVLAGAGSRRSTLMRPIFSVALLVAVSAFAVQNFVKPAAWREIRTTIAESSVDLIRSAVAENSDRYLTRDLYFSVGNQQRDGTFRSVFFADTRDPAATTLIYAKSASLDPTAEEPLLLLRDGQIQRGRPGSTPSIVDFGSYAISLYDFAGNPDGEVRYGYREAPLSVVASAEPVMAPYRGSEGTYRAEFHRRMTSWLYCFTFAALGLAAFGQPRTGREGLGPAALLPPTAIALAMRYTGFALEDTAGDNAAIIPFIYLLPIGGFVLFLLVFLSNQTLSSALRLPRPMRGRTRSAGVAR